MSRALAALLLLLPPPLLAGPPEPGPAALERLARTVAGDVRAAGTEGPVALFLAGGSPELRRAWGTLLAARLAEAGLAPRVLEAPSAEAAEALARDTGAQGLVRLTLSLETGVLHVRGDLVGTWVNFWSGRSPSRPPGPAAALARDVEADAALLALAAVAPSSPAAPRAPRVPRLVGAVFTHLPTPPAALAAGDLDEDGRDEVVVLTERAVQVFAADGHLVAERSLDVLPPSSTAPREPFGAVAVLPSPPRIAAFSARFAHGEVLALERGVLRFVSRWETVPLGPDARGAFVPGQTAFAPEVRVGPGEQRLGNVPARFTTFSAAGPHVLLVHPDGTGSYYAQPTAAPVSLGGLGAGSALGDLDGDGTPEVITTSPELQPSPDTLRVLALSAGVSPPREPLWQGALPAGRALQVVTARLEDDATPEVVVGLTRPDGSGELFLLRQETP